MKHHPTAPSTEEDDDDDSSFSFIDKMWLDMDGVDEILDDPMFWDILTSQTEYDHDVNQNTNYETRADHQGAVEMGNDALDDSGNIQDSNRTADISCDCCQVLREIIHTKGPQTTKLEIHGKVGVVAHAILETSNFATPATKDYQMLDFGGQSAENIKEYLKWYFEDRRQHGYVSKQDPLSSYYEALCTGYDWVNTSDAQTMKDPPKVPRYAMEVPPKVGQRRSSSLKRELTLQRERIKHMVLADFTKYFDVPIRVAAKRMLLCTTVIKKKLRSFKISRWPYRKVKSIKRKITMWRKDLAVKNPVARLLAEYEVEKLQKQVDDILAGDMEALNTIPIR